MCVCVGGGDRVGGGATVFAEATRINEDTIVSNAALIFLSLSLSLSLSLCASAATSHPESEISLLRELLRTFSRSRALFLPPLFHVSLLILQCVYYRPTSSTLHPTICNTEITLRSFVTCHVIKKKIRFSARYSKHTKCTYGAPPPCGADFSSRKR